MSVRESEMDTLKASLTRELYRWFSCPYFLSSVVLMRPGHAFYLFSLQIFTNEFVKQKNANCVRKMQFKLFCT